MLSDWLVQCDAMKNLAADVPNERSHRMLLSCGFQQLSECERAVYRLRTYQTALQREP